MTVSWLGMTGESVIPKQGWGEVFHFSNTLLYKWYYYTGSGTLSKTVVCEWLHFVFYIWFPLCSNFLVETAFYGHNRKKIIKHASFAIALNSELYLNPLSVDYMVHYIFRLLFYLSVQTLSMHIFALCSTLKKNPTVQKKKQRS